jgi:hypothetical protein
MITSAARIVVITAPHGTMSGQTIMTIESVMTEEAEEIGHVVPQRTQSTAAVAVRKRGTVLHAHIGIAVKNTAAVTAHDLPLKRASTTMMCMPTGTGNQRLAPGENTEATKTSIVRGLVTGHAIGTGSVTDGIAKRKRKTMTTSETRTDQETKTGNVDVVATVKPRMTIATTMTTGTAPLDEAERTGIEMNETKMTTTETIAGGATATQRMLMLQTMM